MKRTIIKINENICNGCGLCIEGCHEGALQLIDGKARIISDLYCDGLGACIGECPVGAIELEEREAEPYNEDVVMDRIAPKGERVIRAHLLHLKEHNEIEFLNQGLNYLNKHKIKIDMTGLIENNQKDKSQNIHFSCPGKQEMSFSNKEILSNSSDEQISQLQQWPIQLHLLNPEASYFKNADVLLAADCTAYAYGNFHDKFMKNHSIAIACPKLDTDINKYIDKITEMINKSNINTLTIVIMEVTCCMGLFNIAKEAVKKSVKKIPIKKIVIGIKGSIVEEEWIL